VCFKLLLIINLEELPDLIPWTFLFRVPPRKQNDWDENVLAVKEEAEVRASVSAIGDSGEESTMTILGCELLVMSRLGLDIAIVI
jgi:hypothetical protein